MSRARDLSRFANQQAISIDSSLNVGINSSSPDAKLDVVGVVSATEFYGDGSNLTGVSSPGLGTALSDDTTSPLNSIYFTNANLSVASTITVNPPSSASAAFTQYANIVLQNDADLIVADGDTFIPDILGIGTDVEEPGTLTGGAGKLRVDNITNKAGTGSPNFPFGMVIAGVVTATDGSFSGNVSVGGTLTYEDVTSIDSVGIITAQSGIQVTGGSVGIGTAIPGALLSIESTAANAAKIRLGFDSPRYYDIFRGSTTNSGYLNFYGSQSSYVGYTFGGVDGEWMRITTAGKMGVGTETPSQILELKTGEPRLCLNGTTSNSDKGIEFEHNGTRMGHLFHNPTSGEMSFAVGENTGGSHYLTFKSGNGTEKMRLTSGVVASFGNSSPPAWANDTGYYNIQLGKTGFLRADTDTTNTFMTIGQNAYKDSGGWKYTVTAGASSIFQQGGIIKFETAGSGTAGDALSLTERLRITSTGFVGIGEDDPDSLLHIGKGTNTDDGAVTFTIGGSNANTRQSTITKNNVGSGDRALEIRAATGGTDETIKFFSDSTTERMRIDSSGQVLIGTTSDFVRGNLQVIDGGGGEITIGRNDTTVSSGNDIGHLYFASNDETGTGVLAASIIAYADANHTSASAPTRLTFSTTAVNATSPTERMRITDTGALLVQGVYDGTTSTGANVVVEPDGTIRRSTSSIKYKNNVTTLTDDLADKILECRAVSYTSKCDGDDNTKINYGLIAEEVYDVDPSLVFTDNGEPEGVQYDRFVPHLVNLVKRQKTQIETLEQRLTDAGL